MNMMLELAVSLAVLTFLTGLLALVLTVAGAVDRWRHRQQKRRKSGVRLT